ncbi:GIY-YIG nuclease family protein [Candidatus Dojkabacteria bacterium]|nr:GIY-YIG nuclease family protein [Candidatus Dojkabacteria bacterium]
MYYYVYVLQSLKNEYFYIGFTTNLKKRVSDHNNGRNTSTKNRKPLKLIYFEGYLNKKDALGREKFLKSGSGMRYLKKQMRHYFML